MRKKRASTKKYLAYDPYWKAESIQCGKCKLMRTREMFWKSKSKAYGVESTCIPCYQESRGYTVDFVSPARKRYLLRAAKCRAKNGHIYNARARERYQDPVYHARIRAIRKSPKYLAAQYAARVRKHCSLEGRKLQSMYAFAKQYGQTWDNCRFILNIRKVNVEFEILWKRWAESGYLFCLSPAYKWASPKPLLRYDHMAEISVVTVAKKRGLTKDKHGNNYDQSGNLIRPPATLSGDAGTLCGPGSSRGGSLESSQAILEGR